MAGTDPDAMTVEEHRNEVVEHAREARAHRERYDPDARGLERYPQVPYRDDDFYWGTKEYNPTAPHLRHADEHERHAEQHLRAARHLKRFEERQCQAFPPETRVACPLLGRVEAIGEAPQGVRLRVGESRPPFSGGSPMHGVARRRSQPRRTRCGSRALRECAWRARPVSR